MENKAQHEEQVDYIIKVEVDNFRIAVKDTLMASVPVKILA